MCDCYSSNCVHLAYCVLSVDIDDVESPSTTLEVEEMVATNDSSVVNVSDVQSSDNQASRLFDQSLPDQQLPTCSAVSCVTGVSMCGLSVCGSCLSNLHLCLPFFPLVSRHCSCLFCSLTSLFITFSVILFLLPL